ncbi:MAG: FGGY-family carbohydrate kinase [Planctomycetota bacterium]
MSKGDLFIGIDLGTTALKAAVFTAGTGRRLAAVAHTIPVRVSADGGRLIDPRAIDRALAAVMAALRNALGTRWAGVAGLSLAAQGGSAVVADRSTGRPLTPLYPWNDARALGYMNRVVRSKPAGYWQRRIWRNDPGAGLARMLWLRAHQPALIRKGTIYAGAGEYMYFGLTRVWRQDVGSAIQVGCFDVPTRRLVQAPLDVARVPLDWVAPLREGHTLLPLGVPAARRFGLRPSIPVGGPYMDHEAGWLAMRDAGRHPLACSLGTAWVGNFVMRRGAAWRSPFQLVIPAPVDDGWLVVQPLMTGNMSLDWALTTMIDRDLAAAWRAYEAVAAGDPLPPPGLVCVPWLGRPNPLVAGAFGAGSFTGVSPATGRADLVRALVAGMAFEFHRVFAALHVGRLVDAVVLGGGAARSVALRRLLAALWAPIPVFIPVDGEYAGARGAIFPLDADASRAGLRRVPRPPLVLAREIGRRAEEYGTAFNALFGSVPSGGPITVTKW